MPEITNPHENAHHCTLNQYSTSTTLYKYAGSTGYGNANLVVVETNLSNQPPPPYTSSIERSSATLAELEAKIDQINRLDDVFQLSVAAFKDFLSIQESATLSRGQLTIVRSQIVLILEECARFEGGRRDLSEVLAVIDRSMTSLSRLRSHIQWEVTIKGLELIQEPEADIFNAYEELQIPPNLERHRQQFLSAQKDDRAQLEKLLSILESSISETEDTILEIITGKQPYNHVTRELAVFGEILNGKTPARPLHYIHINTRNGDELWNLLLSCWKFDPEQRPTARDGERISSGIAIKGLNYSTEFGAEDSAISKPGITGQSAKLS
ncbi:hypothetical protein B0J17DRAFT_633741 [Rhizoctonia solani]|nr:hypothetical protein B0J17DRAFT_633741 [Rhizoctonia solani]